MKILLLAPQPFYQTRGTPIDVLLVLRVLAERKETRVDLVVYDEGEDVDLPNLKIVRTPSLFITQNIRPGFSLKKLIADFFMFLISWRLIRKKNFDLIHAGEESVFMAMFFKLIYKIPYAYDLDSSIAQQIVEKIPSLQIFAGIFNWLERLAIRHSLVNLPVCNALAELCQKNGSRKTVTIHDISQLKNPDASKNGGLKRQLGIDHLILLYCGNLEKYQGIDLLLDSFALACKKTNMVDLLIIGGVTEDIARYREKAKNLGIAGKTHFIGPKPFEQLDEILAEADILVAPRIKGINTPMKIFPYLHSGKPILLTDIYAHNQILTSNEAYFAPDNNQGFADAILHLVDDKNLRNKLGRNGRKFVEKNHTFKAHSQRLNNVYDWVERQTYGPYF